MNINDRVKEIRLTLEMSQEEFGAKIGLTKSGISSIENKTRNVTDKHILLLSNELEVNKHWLETGEGEMFESNDKALVDQLAKEYNLDDSGKRFIEAFISLPQKQREAITNFTRLVFEETVKANIPEVIIDGERITDPDEAIEAKTVIQEIREEKKATGKSSDSQLGKDA